MSRSREVFDHRRRFLQQALFAAAGMAGSSFPLACQRLSGASPEPASQPLTPGNAVQIFVDLDRIESLENVQQVFHSAEKHSDSPVIRKVKPWEHDRGTWGSVIYDEEEKLFKAWYGAASGRQKEYRPGSLSDCSVLCYATSQDGIHWDRPELGLHEVLGTRANNVVIGDDHHNGLDHWESVLKDPFETDPQRRYKGLGWSSNDWDGPMSGIYSMTSPDGLHWTHPSEPVFHYHPRPGTNDLGPVGDAQSLMIDPLRHRYVAFLRSLPNRSYSVSDDFETWTPPQISLQAKPEETVNTIYNHMGFVYGDRYLGLLTYFQRDPANPLLNLWLLSSRNGETWERTVADRPLIDVGEVGEWDRFIVMLTGAPPIRVGDRIYIYYRGLANRHKPYEGQDDGDRQGGGIGLATLRLDGFASLQAGYDGGKVTTKPMLIQGSELRINIKGDSGRLSVGILDESGEPIPGFDHSDCDPLRIDEVNRLVTWNNSPSLDLLRDRPIRLQFHLANVRLYSFRFGTT